MEGRGRERTAGEVTPGGIFVWVAAETVGETLVGDRAAGIEWLGGSVCLGCDEIRENEQSWVRRRRRDLRWYLHVAHLILCDSILC